MTKACKRCEPAGSGGGKFCKQQQQFAPRNTGAEACCITLVRFESHCVRGFLFRFCRSSQGTVLQWPAIHWRCEDCDTRVSKNLLDKRRTSQPRRRCS